MNYKQIITLGVILSREIEHVKEHDLSNPETSKYLDELLQIEKDLDSQFEATFTK